MAEQTSSQSGKKRVVIAGGGLSGLCLAQAMLRDGWDVDVYERDAGSQVRGQGYRLTLRPHGFEALRECLPDGVFQFIVQTTKQAEAGAGFVFSDAQLEELLRRNFPVDGSALGGQADRNTLRQGLLIGLKGRVHFGKAVASYEESTSGAAGRPVQVVFQDGTRTSADVLVGADGVHSRVRKQRLPDADPEELEMSAVYGMTLFDKQPATSLLQRTINNAGLLALGDDTTFFTTAMRFKERPAAIAHRLGLEVGLCGREDYLMWAVSVPGRRDPIQEDPVALHQLALQRVAAFHPDVVDIVAKADRADTLGVPLRRTPPQRPWQPSRVTLIGDAVHTMPPFTANGANTALVDAATLSRHLRRHLEDPGASIESCIGAYEAEMRVYSQDAIREGMMMLKTVFAPSKPVRLFVRLCFWLLRTSSHPTRRFYLLAFLISIIAVLSFKFLF